MEWIPGSIVVAVAAFAAWFFSRGKQNAETTEITDRIARGWIKDLQAEVERINRKLDKEIGNRRKLVGHVDVLEEWIAEGKPPPAPPRPILDF